MKQSKPKRLQRIAFHGIPKSQETKLFSEVAMAILLIGAFLLPATDSAHAATTTTATLQISGTISASTSPRYAENAVWIADANYGPAPNFPADKQYVLSDPAKITTCINTLKSHNIKYALLWVGCWNAVNVAAPFIDNPMALDGSTVHNNFPAICAQFKAAGVIPIAWVEDGSAVNSWGPNHGLPNLAPQYRQAYYTKIQEIMAMGFDGYSEDIEAFTGTHQNWIDYTNNQATMLHNIGKLCMPALTHDWQQNTNMYLHVDYIVSMFYGSISMFQDPQGDYYFQENFGQYGIYAPPAAPNPPASPVILGIRNYNTANPTAYPLSWQLAQAQRCIDTYGVPKLAEPKLAGFCFWLYEYMAAYNPTDWADWNNFIIV